MGLGGGGAVSKLHVSPWLRRGMREEMRSFSLKGGRLVREKDLALYVEDCSGFGST